MDLTSEVNMNTLRNSRPLDMPATERGAAAS